MLVESVVWGLHGKIGQRRVENIISESERIKDI